MLVKLESRAETTPVPMDQGDDPNYDDLWAIGFGNINPVEALPLQENVTYPKDFTYPERLQDVNVSFIKKNQCQKSYPFITDNMLCAASPGKDSCVSDSVRMCSCDHTSWHLAIIEIRTVF